jgi:aryl-alcohol dehydrogenase-like predicted oxidoreductase
MVEKMNYKTPRRISKKISEISFGGWQLGNHVDFNESDDEKAIQLVKEAYKQGITLFDTAPNYGQGNSEKMMGIALKDFRDDVFINSKFGHDEHGKINFDVDRLEKSVRSSLKRLQTSYLDGLILHNPGPEMLYDTHPIYEELKRLKEEGLIKYYGVSIDTAEELDIVLTHNQVDIIELMFNIIHQSPKKWFDEIEKQGILLMAKVPLDSGWLTGKYNKGTEFSGIRQRWTKDVIQTRLEIVDKIKEIVGDDILHASLRFVLDFDAVTCVIPGTRTIKHLESNLQTTDYVLTQEKHKALEKLYEDYIKDLNTPW